ncbi:PrgI family protein [Streptomyces sp. SBT349]|uniref:PrgI family protein n=1 Tax=Streptomyces sp. SBT349 TaxID=1580539 RepID=UPI00066C5042|nr:PrgI family protein [Streptomyces sp. SBT349]
MSTPARIPADVEREDRILGPLTARQTALIGAGGLLLYAGYWSLRAWVGPLAYLALITPIAGVLAGVALGTREGIGMDRFLLAALRHGRQPKRMVHAPEGVPPLPGFLDPSLKRQCSAPAPAQLPCQGVDESAGVLDLGVEGRAAVASCSTVNLRLRNGAEQQALVAGFARWLNSLTGPAQILLRTHPVDLTPAAEHLRQQANTLPHPALTATAHAHASFLADLAHGQLPARQLLLAVREPAASAAAGRRAVQRLAEAADVLATADIDARALSGRETAWVIRAACNPEPPLCADEQEVP